MNEATALLCTILALFDGIRLDTHDAQPHIAKLAAPKWADRDAAVRELSKDPRRHFFALKAAAGGNCPETATKAQRILDRLADQELERFGELPEIDAAWYCPERSGYFDDVRLFGVLDLQATLTPYLNHKPVMYLSRKWPGMGELQLENAGTRKKTCHETCHDRSYASMSPAAVLLCRPRQVPVQELPPGHPAVGA